LPTIDHGLSVVPTKEWQDNLSRCLSSESTPSSCTPDSEDGHASQRRRFSGYCNKVTPADWDTLFTIDNFDGKHKIDCDTEAFYLPSSQMNLKEIQRKAWAYYH
jgi:phenylpropionate dioxygenase-like ring-hydroxylating dioxygenase large terminal subunit